MKGLWEGEAGKGHIQCKQANKSEKKAESKSL